jgi:hypothetical protein
LIGSIGYRPFVIPATQYSRYDKNHLASRNRGSKKALAMCHRPPFFRHWKGMFIEIAMTAARLGDAVRARKCPRWPAQALAI